LYVSRNTVKTQVAAIYRTLHCSTRSEVVEKAGELGPLQPQQTVSGPA
jgi:DNA-binding NarL/FixJ family response regulator